MGLLLKPLQFVYNVYAAVAFVAIMLLIFPFVLIARFFGRIRGGNMILRLCMIWADAWFPMIFVFTKKIFEAPHSKSDQFVFVTNHISYLDPAVLVKAIRQPFRPLAKVELSRLPVFGFIYKYSVVAVDRSSAENRAASTRILRSIISKGISILVFPEGTFNMTQEPLKHFYDGAFRLAIETQTPIKPILFLDTYDRMNPNHLFSMTPGKCRIVYLDQIPIEGYGIEDISRLKQKVYDIMEKKLVDYKATWIGDINGQ